VRAWFAAGRPAMRYAGVGVCNLAHFRGMITNGRWQPATLRRGGYRSPVEELAFIGGAAADNATLKIGRCASGG